VAAEPLTLQTSDNLRLEAELVIPDAPVGAAVLTHPHPRHGGNMRSMVPGELIHELPARNIATLRFNFRGMGASEGEFDDGDAERLDIVAALDALHPLVEGLPLILCGSSFGADTALCVDDPRISAWCALAPPLREEKLDRMQAVATDTRPKLLIIAERDQYRVPANVEDVTAAWKNTTVQTVPGADHFFVGRLHVAIDQACRFVEDLTHFGASSGE
jgi:alpha/beta superfamily hydrolase